MAITYASEERLRKKIDQDLRKVEEKLRSDVVRIRFSISENWAGDPAIFFRVVVRDEAFPQKSGIADFTDRISSEISSSLELDELDYIPYFNFRTKSETEQERFKSPEWD